MERSHLMITCLAIGRVAPRNSCWAGLLKVPYLALFSKDGHVSTCHCRVDCFTWNALKSFLMQRSFSALTMSFGWISRPTNSMNWLSTPKMLMKCLTIASFSDPIDLDLLVMLLWISCLATSIRTLPWGNPTAICRGDMLEVLVTDVHMPFVVELWSNS